MVWLCCYGCRCCSCRVQMVLTWSCCWWCSGGCSVAQQSVEVLEVLLLLDGIVDVESQQEDNAAHSANLEYCLGSFILLKFCRQIKKIANLSQIPQFRTYLRLIDCNTPFDPGLKSLFFTWNNITFSNRVKTLNFNFQLYFRLKH